MRLLAFPAAALIILALSVPVFAGAGLPRVAVLQVGAHEVALHNDSPALRTGPNTLSVEIPALPPGHSVELQFRGPAGQTLVVPLLTPVVLGGPDRGHGNEDSKRTPAADAHAAPSADAHAAPSADTHAAPSADAHAAPSADAHAVPIANTHAAPSADAHATPSADTHAAPSADTHAAPSTDTHAAPGFLARGRVRFSSEGQWTAVVQIRDVDGAVMSAEAPIAVSYGGPNRLYLAGTGLLIGSSVLYGLINRRRRTGTGR